MKTVYEAYAINEPVYAISYYRDKSGKDTDHCAIFPAIVKSVFFNYSKDINGIRTEYGLITPDGSEWGDYVSEDQVSDSFDELVAKMKQVWTSNANTF